MGRSGWSAHTARAARWWSGVLKRLADGRAGPGAVNVSGQPVVNSQEGDAGVRVSSPSLGLRGGIVNLALDVEEHADQRRRLGGQDRGLGLRVEEVAAGVGPAGRAKKFQAADGCVELRASVVEEDAFENVGQLDDQRGAGGWIDELDAGEGWRGAPSVPAGEVRYGDSVLANSGMVMANARQRATRAATQGRGAGWTCEGM